MSSRFIFVMAMAAVLAAGQAVTGQAKSGANKTVAITKAAPAAAGIFAFAVAPATINFSSTDPDLGLVTGSSASTINFFLFGGATSATWTLSVQSSTSTFSGCTTIPASAITTSCSSVSIVNYSGTSGTGACTGHSTMSTALKSVASGKEGSGLDYYTVTINFTLSDSWKYIAATSPTCPLSLTYSLDAP